jgi:hypothetical protein
LQPAVRVRAQAASLQFGGLVGQACKGMSVVGMSLIVGKAVSHADCHKPLKSSPWR